VLVPCHVGKVLFILLKLLQRKREIVFKEKDNLLVFLLEIACIVAREEIM